MGAGNPAWMFSELSPGHPRYDPHESEFYRRAGLSEVLIREFIQNALDAKANSEMVEVRITLGRVKDQDISVLLTQEFDKHFEAATGRQRKKNGEIRYALLEDFGTTGLTGSTDWDSESNFSHFWYSLGTSQKQGEKRGRWGSGKTTYYMASEIRVIWGLTIRSDDGKPLLMGATMLKTHKINNHFYHAIGYYLNDGTWRPIDDIEVINNFKKMFGIERGGDEYGLSVVIPYLDGEVKFEGVVKAVIKQYFYAIITGMLTVEIKEENKHVKIDSGNIESIALKWCAEDWAGADPRTIFNFLRECIAKSSAEELDVGDPSDPRITDSSFKNLKDIRNRFEKEELCHFRLPLTVIHKVRGRSQTYVDIYVAAKKGLKEAFQMYVRSGILISGMEKENRISSPVMLLFEATDNTISEFLGDCEEPAHTYWNERTEGFKEKYVNGVKLLRFIKRSPQQILRELEAHTGNIERDLLKDIFWIPAEEEPEEDYEEHAAEGDSTLPAQVPQLDEEKKLFSVTAIKGGFRVNLTRSSGIQLPVKAVIKVAYNTRRGDPFNQYSPFDFDFTQESQIKISHKGCKILKRESNTLEIQIESENFGLTAEGFDERRDLVVKVSVK